jgi:hypothetical protein
MCYLFINSTVFYDAQQCGLVESYCVWVQIMCSTPASSAHHSCASLQKNFYGNPHATQCRSLADKLDRGMSTAVVRHENGVNKLTTHLIYFIKQNKDIRGSITARQPMNVKTACVHCHHTLFRNTARALCACVHTQTGRGYQSMLLKQKAMPSKGWLQDRQCMYKVTFRCGHDTTVAVKKQ